MAVTTTELNPDASAQTAPATIPWNTVGNKLGLDLFTQIFWYHEMACLFKRTGWDGGAADRKVKKWMTVLKSKHGVSAEKGGGVKSTAIWGTTCGSRRTGSTGSLSFENLLKHSSTCLKELWGVTRGLALWAMKLQSVLCAMGRSFTMTSQQHVQPKLSVPAHLGVCPGLESQSLKMTKEITKHLIGS